MLEIKMPEAGFSITEGTVIKWYKEVGEEVGEGDNVVSVETDKITVDIPAEGTGILKEIRYGEGQVVPVGEVIGIIEVEGGNTFIQSAALQGAEEGDGETPQVLRTTLASPLMGVKKISPAAKAMARARGLDLSQILSGSGPGGRIVRQDVLNFEEKLRKQACDMEKIPLTNATVTTIPVANTSTPKISPVSPAHEPRVSEERRVSFTGWRKVIADRMVLSTTKIPHYTMSVKADVTELSQLIQWAKGKEGGPRLTYLPFMMKAMVAGIDVVPEVNALCDDEGFTIKETVNIGVAVDLGEKLLVPVVRDVCFKSVGDLAVELQELVDKARKDKLEPGDVEGGTITLTNIGMFKTHSATSIILPPQVCIVYMGAAVEEPGVWEGRIEIRKKMIFGATFDHRVINGASGGRFLMEVRSCLEDQRNLLIRLR